MEWNVGVVNQPIQAFLESDARPEVQWFPPLGRGKYLADPFGVWHDGQAYVFCEEFDYRTNKGVITRFRLSDGGRPSSGKVVIEMPFHLSFPFLLPFEGQIYCVPETFQAREIALYQADPFPDRWTKAGTLIPNVAGVDSAIFRFDGRWWITCTDSDRGANEALFIWHAPELRGPWRSHSKTPAKTGLRGTRPAGTPFVDHGQLYRPSMDSPRTYGQRILLNRVKRLSPTEFEEEPVAVVEPFRKSPYRYGVHTLSTCGPLTLVDGLRVTFEQSEFARALERHRLELYGWISPQIHKGG